MAYKIISIPIKNGGLIKLKISKHEKKYILDEVIEKNCYFPLLNGQDFMLRLADTVIDIGANVGVFTIYAANLAKNGKVYSFEPVNNNFKRLKQNVELNRVSNVVMENVGISHIQKRVKIYLEKSNTGGHSMHKEKYMNPETIRSSEFANVIPLKTVFDKYKIKKCDFLKIDCEGEESNILHGLPVKYFERIRKIALEFHPNVNEIRLARYLIKQGYKITIYNLDGITGMIFASK